MRKNQQARSILIIQLAGAGDIVIASPIAKALKNTYPNASITWLTHPGHTHLLKTNININHILTWDKKNWSKAVKEDGVRSTLKTYANLYKQLKKHDFEIVIDLEGSLASGALSLSTGAKLRVGLASREGSHWFMTKTISKNTGDKTQIGAEYRYLSDQLELSYNHWKMDIPIEANSEARTAKLLKDHNINEDYVVFTPFSKTKERLWAEENWQQLALRIRGKYHLRTVILGENDVRHSGGEITKGSGAINLGGHTTLEESCTIISKAKLLIGIDTNLTHLGHALQTPTLAIFGPSCPYTFTEHETSKVIYLDRYCSPCDKKPSCKGKFQCMANITPDQVLTEIKPLMRNQDLTNI